MHGTEGEPLPTARVHRPVVDILSKVAVRRDILNPRGPINLVDLHLERHRMHDADHSRKGRLRRALRDALKLPVDPQS